jgi:hypothetical protein
MLVAYTLKYIKHNGKTVGFTRVSVWSSEYKGKIVSDKAMEIRRYSNTYGIFLGQSVPSCQEVTLDPCVLEKMWVKQNNSFKIYVAELIAEMDLQSTLGKEAE